MDIVLATKNRKKVEEIKKIFGMMGTASRIYTLDDFPDYGEVIEDGNTFEANAVKKALYVSKCTGMTALADDSGLEVEALNGEPGVFSARYAGEAADDKANLEKLLKEMAAVPPGKRNARFVCCIAMASQGETETFIGHVEGTIGIEPRGMNGFGYDPVFFPKGHDRTFAEMNDNEKNVLSHRGEALGELQKHMLEKRGYIRGF